VDPVSAGRRRDSGNGCWRSFEPVTLLLIGACLLAAIIGLFWLKDRLQSPLLARIAYSEPVMRLAVIGAAMSIIGLLLVVAGWF
jgi:hypothetical protein